MSIHLGRLAIDGFLKLRFERVAPLSLLFFFQFVEVQEASIPFHSRFYLFLHQMLKLNLVCDLDYARSNKSRLAEVRYAMSKSFGGANATLLLKRFDVE